MPGFDKHLQTAFLVALVAGIPIAILTSTPHGPAVTAAVGIGVIGGITLGGVIPDIDSHSSIPRRILNRILIVAFIGVAVYVFVPVETIGSSIPSMNDLLTTGVVAVVGAFAIPVVVQKVMPSHRGMLHNPLVWVAVTVPAAFAIRAMGIPGLPDTFDQYLVPIAFLTIGMGVYVHSALDGAI